jgi:hypothetical protein
MSPEPISAPVFPSVSPHLMVEHETGHGHGMSRNRTPKSDQGLPHEDKRDEKQPYSREVEEYSGQVTRTPRDQGEKDSDKGADQDV